MRALASLVPLLGCGLMMAACMGLMGRGRAKPPVDTEKPVERSEIEALRAEVAELRAERDRSN
jgi:hypothetical protein